MQSRRSIAVGAHGFWLLLLGSLLAAGCQTEPVYDVDRAIVPEEPDWTLTDMTRAIQRAGARRGWDMRIVEPGKINGRLRKPDVTAKIEVDYEAFEFSIHYRDSQNLGYSSGQIRSKYNRWIYNLQEGIRKEFLLMRPTEVHVPRPAK